MKDISSIATNGTKESTITVHHNERKLFICQQITESLVNNEPVIIVLVVYEVTKKSLFILIRKINMK